jgi:hypothetical protein
MRDLTGNLEPLLAGFPNRVPPVVRVAGGGEPGMMRWGCAIRPVASLKNPVTSQRPKNGHFRRSRALRPASRGSHRLLLQELQDEQRSEF